MSIDTVREEVTKVGKTTIIHNGENINVDCQIEDKKTVCRDASTAEVIQMKDQLNPNSMFMPRSKAPNGKYWKLDCTWIQKMIYANCWEGDDGKGKACNFWERYIFRMKCYDEMAIRVTATVVGTIALVYATI